MDAEREKVCCLACDAVYAKPVGAGTVADNAGCPACGYVGWGRCQPPAAGPLVSAVNPEHAPRRFAADQLPSHPLQ